MMKKLAYIVLLLAAFSCETPLFVDPVGPQRELVLQARLFTSDSLHTVYATYSLHDSLSRAEDLCVSCYVNGERVAQVTEASRVKDKLGYQDDPHLSAYCFLADIHPGDSVRIEAEGPENRAVAKVKAPAAPPVPEVTVEKVTRQDADGREQRCFRFRLRVRDISGERNWYRLDVATRRVLEWYAPAGYYYFWEEEGWRITDDSNDATWDVRMDNTRDPVLNPDGRSVERWNHDYQANEYNFFTDELFEDGVVDLTLDGLCSDFISYEHCGFIIVGSYDRYRSSHTAFISLQSLSREDYLNSRLMEMDYFQPTGIPFVDGLFSEDIVLPRNVEGGLGLVTVRSVSRVTVDLGIREFSFESFDDLPAE